MKKDTFDLIYEFLKKKNLDSKSFTLNELSDFIDKKESTSRTYLSKKLVGVYVEKLGKDLYKPTKMEYLTRQFFHDYMSQNSQEVVDSKKEVFERLKDRAIDSYFLAIEIYNRITQKNKNEAFCILVVNAWELLLKSYLAFKYGIDKIYYKDSMRSLSINDCIKKVYENENDYVRKNLERIIELRDKAIHLLIPELNFDISRLFQSCVINFLDFLAREFNDNLLYRLNPGFIALIIDKKNKPNFKKLSIEYGEKASEELKSFLDRFRAEEKESSDIRYAVPIEYKLVLTKRESDSDIQLFKSSSGDNKGMIIEVSKDIDTSHPFTRTPFTEELNKRLITKDLNKVSTRDVDAMIFYEKIKKQKQSIYHYHLESPSVHRYSYEFMDFLLDKIMNSNEYLKKCRKNYTEHLKSRRKKKQ